MLRPPPLSTLSGTRIPDTALSRTRVLSARPEPGPLRVPTAARAGRRLADRDARGRRHRPRRRRGIRPGDPRHADGYAPRAAGPRSPDRAEWFARPGGVRSEENTSEIQPIMRISYAAFCLTKK